MSSSNGPSEAAIQQFGSDDYERLLEMEEESVLQIEEITDPYLKKASKIMNDLIQRGLLVMMDKESGVVFDAQGVVGFKDGKILVFHDC